MDQKTAQISDERKKLIRNISVGIKQAGGINFGCYTLTDGSLSPYYVDLRPMMSTRVMVDGKVLGEHIVDAYELMIKEDIGADNIDLIISIPKASQLYAGALWERTGIPVGYVEEGEKAYGMKRNVEAFMRDRDRIVLVDDLITSSKSKKGAIQSIIYQAEKDGINVRVDDLLVLLTRLQGGPEELLQHKTPVSPNGIRTHYLMNILDMINCLHQEQLISAEQHNVAVEFTKTRKLDEEYVKKHTQKFN